MRTDPQPSENIDPPQGERPATLTYSDSRLNALNDFHFSPQAAYLFSQ